MNMHFAATKDNSLLYLQSFHWVFKFNAIFGDYDSGRIKFLHGNIIATIQRILVSSINISVIATNICAHNVGKINFSVFSHNRLVSADNMSLPRDEYTLSSFLLFLVTTARMFFRGGEFRCNGAYV